MSMDEITAIVKRQYETGAYGGAHFRVSDEVRDSMLTEFLPREAREVWSASGPSTEMLMAIPVVVDDSLDERTWRLVDTHTGEVLFEGTT